MTQFITENLATILLSLYVFGAIINTIIVYIKRNQIADLPRESVDSARVGFICTSLLGLFLLAVILLTIHSATPLEPPRF